jgi:site-specific DNA recombinase
LNHYFAQGSDIDPEKIVPALELIEADTWQSDLFRLASLSWSGHADEKKEHEAAIARLQAEYDRLQTRLHAMYVDKLDGRIDQAFFESMSGQWRSEQDACLRDIARHQAADASYLEEGSRLLDLAHSAQGMFAKQEAAEKRRLLNFVLSNSVWDNGELHATFGKPFDLLAETTAIAANQAASEGALSTKRTVWLPGPDSNQRPSG